TSHSQRKYRLSGVPRRDVAAPALFDHLIGKRNELARYFEPERFRGRATDDELEPGRLIDRQVLGFGAPENLSGIDADLTIAVGKDDAVAHQSAVGDQL